MVNLDETSQARWRGKKNVYFELHPLVDYKQVDSKLSSQEIISILESRREPFQLDYKTLLKSLYDTLPPHAPISHYETTSKFKASYAVAELDFKRTMITTEELCGFEWHINVRANPLVRGHLGLFHQQGLFVSDMLHEVIEWRFLDTHGRIKIYNIEPLSVTRNVKDWSWILMNRKLEFTNPV